MSWVYVARDLEALRDGTYLQFAFKSFKEPTDPNHVRRFLREARRWIQAGSHDHIVLALFATEMEGWPLLQLEYVHGHSLKHWIERRRLSLPQAITFAIQLCQGMIYVSERVRLVHRDLKPSNLLIDDVNLLKITDLGISLVNPGLEARGEGGEEGIAGTAPYMSPEQFETAEVSHLSDIYSTGVVLYEMLTGRRPFRAPSREEYKHLHQTTEPVSPRVWNPAVTELMARIVLRCLAKDPGERFSSFAELRQALEGAHENLPVKKPVPQSRQREISSKFILLSQCFSLLTLGRYADACKVGQQVIDLDPEMADAWNNIGVALAQLNRLEEAVPYLEKALELRVDYVEALANLGGLYARIDRLEAARDKLQQAVDIDPNYAEAWANFGLYFTKTGAEDRVFECFDQAAKADPGYWKVWLIRADACLQLGRTREALDCCDKLASLHISHAELWHVKARIWLETAAPEKALEACNEGLRYHPDDAGIWGLRLAALEALGDAERLLVEIERAIDRFPNSAEFHLVHGLWFSRHKQPRTAEKAFARAAELDSTSVLAWQFRGEMLAQIGRTAEAVPCFEEATRLAPRKSLVWQHLGICHLKLDQLAEALSALEESAALDPEDGHTRMALEQCRKRWRETGGKPRQRSLLAESLELMRRGEVDRAIERLTAALAVDPRNADLHQMRGACHAQAGRYEEALADLGRALDMDSQDTLTHALYAKALSETGRPSEALEAARRTAAMAPDSFFAHQTLAELAQSRQLYEEATTAYEQAILRLQANPELCNNELLASFHCNMGICLKQLGDFAAAFEHLDKSVTLDAANTVAIAELNDFK
jgi:tetratricopeptide (TPR) repeat protein